MNTNFRARTPQPGTTRSFTGTSVRRGGILPTPTSNVQSRPIGQTGQQVRYAEKLLRNTFAYSID